MDSNLILERQTQALIKIKSIYGTEDGEFGPTLFVEHHLEEIENEYWVKKFGSEKPDPVKILEALVLVNKWASEDDDNIDTFDFSLPDNVTNYLLSVRFADDGQVEEISMES